MSTPRTARIVSSQELGPEARLLEFALPDGEPLGFTGGQYIIINTGIALPGGKTAKRAYSILSSDADQSRFQIAVRRIGSGPGSNYMHEAKVGTELPFSGPWGQYFPEDSRPRQTTWVLATDTGITAALGLVRGAKFAPQLPGTELVWLVSSPDYFISEARVREWVPAACKIARLERIPAANETDRLTAARAALKTLLAKGLPESVFLSGDGNILYPFRDELVSTGVPEGAIRLECFFNNPFRKVPVS